MAEYLAHNLNKLINVVSYKLQMTLVIHLFLSSCDVQFTRLENCKLTVNNSEF